MSIATKNLTKTISLRIPIDYDNYLESMAKKTGRSKSNYIKRLIQNEKTQNQLELDKHADKMQKIGNKLYRSQGLNPDTMTDQDAYNFFKAGLITN